MSKEIGFYYALAFIAGFLLAYLISSPSPNYVNDLYEGVAGDVWRGTATPKNFISYAISESMLDITLTEETENIFNLNISNIKDVSFNCHGEDDWCDFTKQIYGLAESQFGDNSFNVDNITINENKTITGGLSINEETIPTELTVRVEDADNTDSKNLFLFIQFDGMPEYSDDNEPVLLTKSLINPIV